jgi:SPP1 family predicted phage head-tail adaptor
MIPAGRRNKRITIQESVKSPDAAGQQQITWIDVCYPWAAIEPLSVREAFRARQSQSQATHQITIPYRADLDTRMRATYNSRVFNFDSILDAGEAHEELVILAIETV